MDKATKLTPNTPHSQWLWRNDTQQLLTLLNEGEATTRCVGGCVRDTLLGLADADTEIDMATQLQPDAVIARLRDAKIRWLKTGFDYGTITAMLPHGDGWCGYEITTLRRDVESDGRHARVEQTDDWGVDAARRDFSINALYADGDGTLYDPTGLAFADVAARCVRFIGDAAQRVDEDYLRVLRYFRFHFSLSPQMPMTDNNLAICAAAYAGVKSLSPERRHVELMRILQGEYADKALAQLAKIGLISAILNIETINVSRLKSLINNNPNTPPIIRLAALLDGENVEPVARALRLSKKQTALLAASLSAPQWHSMADLPAALYREGAEIVAHQALLLAASGGDAALCAAVQTQATDYVRPIFPLTGAMMKEAGMAAGPQMGVMHKKLEDWWIANNFPNKIVIESELKKRLI